MGQPKNLARTMFAGGMSPSERARLEARDSGDKVKCPVCHRGMDHWKPPQRQEVSVHILFCSALNMNGLRVTVLYAF